MLEVLFKALKILNIRMHVYGSLPLKAHLGERLTFSPKVMGLSPLFSALMTLGQEREWASLLFKVGKLREVLAGNVLLVCTNQEYG